MADLEQGTSGAQPVRRRRSERFGQTGEFSQTAAPDWRQVPFGSGQVPVQQPQNYVPNPTGIPGGNPYAVPQTPNHYFGMDNRQTQQKNVGQSTGELYRYAVTHGTIPQKPGRSSPLKRLVLILALVAVVAGLVYGITKLTTSHQLTSAVTAYNAVYCEGVYVDGIALGGMTQQEARAAVTEQAMERVNWHVRITLNGESMGEISAADIGFAVDVESALREAWEQGHIGTVQERYDAMQLLAENPYHGYSITAGNDTSYIDNLLESLSLSLYIAPREAELIAFDADRTYPFIFQDEAVGRTLDITPVKAEIYRMLSDMESGEIQLQPQYIYPTTTVAWLQENLLTVRGTSSTRISSTSTENRTNNIRRCFELISGTVIEPGKVFSFNDIVGQRTVQNGFYEADEYVYETVQTGIGGGSCQASTTVYQAAIYSGLEITERRPHSMSVGYTEKGKDATVYWYSNHKIDLKFRNNTDHPIYITAAVQSRSGGGTQLYANVTIYGATLGNVTYDFAVDTVEIAPPEEPEIIKDKKGEYVLYTDEEYVYRQASSGYVVDSYRVMKVDGVEAERVFLFEDTYRAKAQQIYVGVQTPPFPAEDIGY